MKHFFILLFLICSSIAGFSQIIFSEDFDGVGGPTAGGAGTYSFPSGWLLVNVDNKTPASSVSYVNEAWERREDFSFNVADSAAFSTSWYSPAGAADDWMWTPLIGPITTDCKLKWNAVTYDASYKDGYEVRIMTVAPTGTTGDIGNMVTNSTQIFSVAAENSSWTAHEVDLSAYAGQSVYIGFRNTSNDKFLLLIDDIVVEKIINYDLMLTKMDTVSQYTSIPLDQAMNAGHMGATIKNNGLKNLHNIQLNFQIQHENGSIMYNNTATLDSLKKDSSVHLSTAAFTPMFTGNYYVHIAATMTETDGLPGNDTAFTWAFNVHDSVYARDNGTATGSLGIGAGNGGYLGQDFEIKTGAYLSSISMFFNRGYTGKNFGAAIWNMTAGKPDSIIAVTDTLTYPDDSADFYTIDIFGGQKYLEPGFYTVTAIEFDSTLALGNTGDRFTNGHVWVNWPTIPSGDWANVETFGSSFAKTFIIRMNFYDPCEAFSSNTVAVNASCSTCNDGSATVSVSGGIPPYHYSWNNSDTTANITNLLPGEYIVNITDEAGCSTSDTITVSFPDEINDLSSNMISIFPNPSNGDFSITIDKNISGSVNIEIIDVSGKVIYSEAMINGKLNISDLADGVYTLKIKNNDQVFTKRVVVN